MTLARVKSQLLQSLKDRVYRAEFVRERVRSSVALQIRAIRDQREMTQTELGDLLGKAQAWISRLENPEYGKMTVATLLELAEAFDTDLEIKFRPFSKLLDSLPRQGPSYFMVKDFESEFGEGVSAPQPATTAAPPPMFIQHGLISTYTTVVNTSHHALNMDTLTFIYPSQRALPFRLEAADSYLGIAPSVYPSMWGFLGIATTEAGKEPIKKEWPDAA